MNIKRLYIFQTNNILLKQIINKNNENTRQKLYNPLSKIVFSVLLLFFLSDNLIASPVHRFDSVSNEIERIYFSKGEKSRQLISELYEIAYNYPDSSFLISQCLYKEGLLSYAHGSIDSTLTERIKNQLKRTDKIKHPFENALLSFSLGSHLSAKGDYSEAFEISLEALNKFKILGDSAFTAKTLNLLGAICSHISLYGMSKDYHSEALTWASPEDPEYLRIKVNLYRLNLLDQDSSALTIDAMKNLILDIKAKKDTSLLATANLHLGAFYFRLHDNQNAYFYWNKVEQLIKNLDNLRFNSILYHYLGVYHIFEDKDYKKALEYLNLSKKISEESQNLVHLSTIYDIISETYELLGNNDSAFVYLKKHQALTKSLVATPKAIEAYQAYVATFLEASENKLTIAQQQIKISNRQFLALVMVAVSLVLLALLFYQQKRIKVNENRELAKQLDHEKKIQQLQKEKQDEVIEAKTREITSYSLLLSNKNNILKQILALNAQLAKTQNNIPEFTKKINNVIQSNYQIDEDWKDFKMRFDKVHPSFFDKLKQYCADLTENNLRICAYYRLGMTTKQIAQILHITPASVSIHRHRIKKKLALKEEDELDEFIRNI